MPVCCGAFWLPGGVGMTAVPAPQVLRLTVPGVPPSVNHQYVRTKRGQALSKEAKRYAETVQWYAWEAAKRHGWRCTPKGQQVIVRLWYYWPDRRRRDTHNAYKVLLDAMQGVVYEDDRDVLPRVMAAEMDRANPRVEIEVERVRQKAV